MRAFVVLCCVLTLAVACQPAGGPGSAGPAVPSDGATGRPLGAPVAGLPANLDELLARGQQIAEEWQAEPVLVEVEVEVGAGRWNGARLAYMAADSDRFLQLVATDGGFAQERITLSTLQVEPVPREGVDQIPPFPDDALEPAQLATAESVTACGVGEQASVFYVTGAPVAWDGAAWSPAPEWRATVTTPEGPGAAVDVAGGEAECLQ